MPINITDELHAATTKGKIASAKEVFLTGDTENLQQIGEKTHQLEDSIKNIAATGGASTAAAVTFDNAASGMTAVNAQGAIDEVSSISHFAKRGSAINISTNYNSTNTAEILTLSQAINKVSSKDRVLGFQGIYLASNGWHTIIYTGDSLSTWADSTKWIDFTDNIFNSISKNATFAGIATPITNPGIPDGPVFYFAIDAGTYINFGGIIVGAEETAILRWDNGTWLKNDLSFITKDRFETLEQSTKCIVIKDIITISDLKHLSIGDYFIVIKENKVEVKQKIGESQSIKITLHNGAEILYGNERYKYVENKFQITSGNLSDFTQLENLDYVSFTNHRVDGNILYSDTARLCSELLLANGLSISINSGYKMYAYFYDKNKQILTSREFGDTGDISFDYPFTSYVRLVFMHSDKTSAMYSIKGVVNYVKGLYYNTRTIPEMLADANKRIDTTEQALVKSSRVNSDELISLKSYQTGVEVGETISPLPVVDSTISCYSSSCKKDDSFLIKGSGANNARLWCFTDDRYKVLSVAHPETIGPVNLVAPENAAFIFINLNNYDKENDYIEKLGGWVNTEMLKRTAQVLSSADRDQVLDNIGAKVIKLAGWTFDFKPDIIPISNVGDIYYDYKSNILRRCTDVTSLTFITEPFNKAATYMLEGKMYKSDGTSLISDSNYFDFSKQAKFSKLTFVHKSVAANTGMPSLDNPNRLCSPLLYVDGNTKIKTKEGYAFYYYILRKDGHTLLGYSENNNTEFNFREVPCLIRIVFKKLDNTSISTTDDIIETFEGFYMTSDSFNENETEQFLFSDISPWEPAIVDSGYSNPTSKDGRDTKREDWTAVNKYKYYAFLANYYDIYLGKKSNYKVSKKGLWVDSANTGHEVFEYDFCPKNYKCTIMLSAGLNADETQGIWGLATFIRCMMNEEEPQLALMKRNIRFKIIPILNASGFDEDLLRYNYADGTNPNMNFNFKDSWEKNNVTWTSKGDYPDSCLETKGLKKWINDHSGIALLWLDLHTGRWNSEYPNTKILDIRFSSEPTYFSAFNSTHVPLIKQFYIDKGYINSTNSIGAAISVRENLDYQKHRYALDICGINSAMPEMHLESTGYGSDGYTNNSPEGIKAYVLQIRQLIMFVINKANI